MKKLIDKNNECIICYEQINTQNIDTKIFKNCTHNNNYHVECINNWINESIDKNRIPTCPICNNNLDVSVLYKSKDLPSIARLE